jgi:hypothetical protein
MKSFSEVDANRPSIAQNPTFLRRDSNSRDRSNERMRLRRLSDQLGLEVRIGLIGERC